MFVAHCRHVVLLLTLAASAHSQWLQTNGPFGGTVHDLASTGEDLYALVSSAGIFRSTDKGLSWTQGSNDLSKLFFLNLTSSGTTLYAATYNQIFRSTDNASTWVWAGPSPMNIEIRDLVALDSIIV